MEFDNGVEENQKRPVFLTVLCVLSFISTGYNLLGNFLNLLKGPLSQEELDQSLSEINKLSEFFNDTQSSFPDIFDKIANIIQYTNANFYMHTSILLATFSLGFFGVLKMFQGFKKGFHLYIIYNLLSIVSIYVSVPPGDVPSFVVIFSVLISALFIFLYSRNLYWMK